MTITGEWAPTRLRLTEDELADIGKIVREAIESYDDVEDPRFLAACRPLSARLPDRLLMLAESVRSEGAGGVVLVSGYLPINRGPTPESWRHVAGAGSAPEDFYFVLLASLFGDAIGWATQQAGRLVHDLVPVRGHEEEQLGSGSSTRLTWHTEEAFHPYRADYLALMCIRNPDSVETTFASVDDIVIEDNYRRTLAEPRFFIRPDPSHLPQQQHNGGPESGVVGALVMRSRQRIERMQNNPEPVPVLFGDPQNPYIRIDPAFMSTDGEDASETALAAVISKLEEAERGMALEPGDVLLIDNYRVVHGRAAFKARFDGTDRWLRRISITRDLRRSRDARAAADARVIY